MARVWVEPLHAHAEFWVSKLVSVQSLDCLPPNVFWEVEVNLISELVVNFACNASNFLAFLARENYMAILSLRVEHHSGHRVVFAFDGDDKFFTILFICCQDIKEVS